MWLGLALVSALFLGMYDVCKKASLKDNAVLPVLFLATLASFLPFGVLKGLSWVFGAESMGGGFIGTPAVALHGLLVLKSLIVSSSWVCVYFAYKHLPITLGAPIRASQPVLTVLGALVFFGERFPLLVWLGIIITLGAYLALSALGGKEGVRFERNGWVGLLLLGTILGAVSALYDKYLLKRHDPLVVQGYYSFYMVLVLGVVLLAFWWPRRHRSTPFTWRWSIPAIGLLLAVADFCYFRALALPGSMIALISLVRRSNVVVSFGLGALIFREKNIRQKALVLLVLVLGIVCIGLGKGK